MGPGESLDDEFEAQPEVREATGKKSRRSTQRLERRRPKVAFTGALKRKASGRPARRHRR